MGTRADEYNHSRVVTQIATITLAGGDADRKLCSQNLSHTINLFPMADGRVGFSRWEHLENVNDVKLFAMNPDCTQMVALAGQHGKPGNSLVQVTETNDAERVLRHRHRPREHDSSRRARQASTRAPRIDPLRVDEEKARRDVHGADARACRRGDGAVAGRPLPHAADAARRTHAGVVGRRRRQRARTSCR